MHLFLRTFFFICFFSAEEEEGGESEADEDGKRGITYEVISHMRKM